MAPLEPWEKVLVDGENYPPTVHGQIPCTDCHAGDQTAEDKVEAHAGLIENPSHNPEDTCGDCHPDVVAHNDDSLHINLEGYWTALDQRVLPEDHDQIEIMFGNHCSSCHSSCGECHVSQPNGVGGGLIDGHIFNETPSMTRNCTACHGSRVGNEYLGKHEGLKADVHFRQGRMTCVDCHGGPEMHGQPANCEECHANEEVNSVPPADHRYNGVQSPRCETCHMPVTVGNDGNPWHEQHAGDLQCQVCHSLQYTSCDNCHVAISDTTGNPFYSTEASYLDFKIGKNHLRSFDRPYEYVTLRHVPVAPDAFDFYGENLQQNFDNRPTWLYTTPHNIQRMTPQSESCKSCHENPDLFLTIDNVAESERQANLPVIMERVPPLDVPEITIEQLLSDPTTEIPPLEGEGVAPAEDAEAADDAAPAENPDAAGEEPPAESSD